MAEKKEKQYVSDNARLMAEWNWEKNNEWGLDPNKLTCGSGKKIWWKCSKGHMWSASIINRSKIGSNCPYCSGKKPIPGKTDLETTNSKLASEWHPTRNQGLTPRDILAFRSFRVFGAFLKRYTGDFFGTRTMRETIGVKKRGYFFAIA